MREKDIRINTHVPFFFFRPLQTPLSIQMWKIKRKTKNPIGHAKNSCKLAARTTSICRVALTSFHLLHRESSIHPFSLCVCFSFFYRNKLDSLNEMERVRKDRKACCCYSCVPPPCDGNKGSSSSQSPSQKRKISKEKLKKKGPKLTDVVPQHSSSYSADSKCGITFLFYFIFSFCVCPMEYSGREFIKFLFLSYSFSVKTNILKPGQQWRYNMDRQKGNRLLCFLLFPIFLSSNFHV